MKTFPPPSVPSIILAIIFHLISFQILHADAWREIQCDTAPPARYFHTMVNIDGTIYLFGGAGESSMGKHDPMSISKPNQLFMNDIWKYNTHYENKWQEEEPADTPPLPLAQHGAAAVNGKMLIFFGYSQTGHMEDMWRYDPAARTWEHLPFQQTLPEARSSFSTVMLVQNPCIFGGMDKDGQPLRNAWTFNNTDGTWEEKYTLTEGEERFGHGAFVQDDKMIVFGGRNAQGEYKNTARYIASDFSSSGSWTSCLMVANPAVAENQPYCFGGRIPKSSMQKTSSDRMATATDDTVSNQTWRLDVETQTWIRCADMPATLQNAAACAYEVDGKTEILIFGGMTADGLPNSRTFVYTPCGTGFDGNPVMPDDYILRQNYPNPFNSRTTIAYRLKNAGHVRILLYDLQGRIVWTITDQYQHSGSHEVFLKASNLASGIYFYRMTVNGHQFMRKMILVE